MNMEMYNKYLLLVIEELKSDPYFYKPDNLIILEVPKNDEELDVKTHTGKIVAVWDLEALGGIKIHNKGEERIPGTNIHEFQILVIHSAFNGIYKECVKRIVNQPLDVYELQVENKKRMPELRKKLEEVIQLKKIVKMQKKLLLILGDFEPRLITKLKSDTGSEDIVTLKKDVKKKLKGTGFDIMVIRGDFNKNGLYKLIYLPTS